MKRMPPPAASAASTCFPAAHPHDAGDQVGLGAQQHPGQLERLLADLADGPFPEPRGLLGAERLFEVAAQAPPVGGGRRRR